MPELPEVEIFRRYVDATALHQKIRSVDPRSTYILETAPRSMEQCLKGHAFDSTRRRGKYIFAALDDGDFLALHFGMTGSLKYYKDQADEPEYTRFLIEFTDNYHLALVMPRKLGAVQCVPSVEAFVQEKELGPDALEGIPDFGSFQHVLEGRKGMAKSVLMNQKIVAGIGNTYSDEILYQAEVHPKKSIDELDDGVLKTIFTKTGYVLRTAIDRNADPDCFPDSWLILQRHEGGRCPQCGGEVRNIKVSGRSAYYCPNCQSL